MPDHWGVVVLWAVTLWVLFACWLLFSQLRAPRLLVRVALGLLGAELVALLMWSYGSELCAQRPCGTVAEIGHAAASQDIPALAAAVIVGAVARAARAARVRHPRSRRPPARPTSR